MTTALVTSDQMAKKIAPSPPPDEPPSETVRVAGDLVEMMRQMCFNQRDERGKRLKVSAYLDGLIRPLVLRDYQQFEKRRASEKKGG